MAVDNARSLALLRKMDHLLAQTHGRQLASHEAQGRDGAGTPLPPERVHQIRTTARRLEALLDRLGDDRDRKQRKLRKRLRQLRRSAADVRDIDVQIVALRKLKIGREQERKARLLQALTEDRSRRERELIKALGHEAVQKLRKHLRRWSAEIVNGAKPAPATTAAARRDGEEFDGVATSLRMFSTLSRQVRSLTPDNLHDYRTRCKRIRYIAEMAGNSSAANRIVAQLKRTQDAIGDWHDWLTLTATAESLFARSRDSALIAALSNVTNAKFVEARGACLESRRILLAYYRAMLAEKRAQRPATLKPRRKRAAPKAAPAAAANPAIPSKSAVAVMRIMNTGAA